MDKDAAPAATAAPAVTAVTAAPAASPSRGAGTADSKPASPEGGGVSVVLTGSLKRTGFLSRPNEADGDSGAATMLCGAILNLLLLLLPSPGDRGRGVTCGLERERKMASTDNYCIGRKKEEAKGPQEASQFSTPSMEGKCRHLRWDVGTW